MKKITILFGADAALPWKAPTTDIITEAIRSSTDYLIDGETFGKWIDNLLHKYNQNPQNNKINFETYIDFLESIWSYLLETDSKIYSSMKTVSYTHLRAHETG